MTNIQRMSWTPKEEKQLLELHRDAKWPFEKLAEFFETTTASITSKINRLIAAEEAARDEEEFTQEEISFILDWLANEAENKPDLPRTSAIAAQWKRSPQRVSQMKSWLKNPDSKLSKAAVTKYANKIAAYHKSKERSLMDQLLDRNLAMGEPTNAEWMTWKRVNAWIQTQIINNNKTPINETEHSKS